MILDTVSLCMCKMGETTSKRSLRDGRRGASASYG